MSLIKILPENLANQIAAGEVIERPASVVKEFIENSIDAGATDISIQIEGDGSRLIRVVDNGVGMEEDDVLLCLERHATSKLDSPEQLSNINTLGFRGEAIPSIASVSKLSITSRPHDAELGVRAEIKFGKIIKVHEMGCASGTVMEVKNLFGNLPARRKFLKTKQTEISHIDEIIKNYALVNPEIGFTCQLQGRTALELSPGDSLNGRVEKIVCRSNSGSLVEFASGDLNTDQDVSVAGCLLSPETVSGSGRVRAFVNGRMVKDRMINHAVNEGMRGFLLKGRRASGVIFISLPVNLVDVNVHPTKQEIRFQKSNIVHSAIVETVRKGMEAYQDTLRHTVFGGPDREPAAGGQDVTSKASFVYKHQMLETVSAAAVSVKPSDQNIVDDSASVKLAENSVVSPGHDIDSSLQEDSISGEDERGKFNVNEPSSPLYTTSEEREGEVEEKLNSAVSTASSLSDYNEFGAPVRFAGQIFSTYILCESEGELLVVDQHAAQERLIFEELRKQYSDNVVPGQVLLFPEVIDLDPADILIIEQHGDEINRLGLDITEFGGDSYIIKAVPAALGHFRADEILRGILDRFSSDGGKGSEAVRMENVLSGMACKAAIKAGLRLLPEEVESLIEQMRHAGIFSHCPHGRPVVKSFSKDDVKKWFFRT